LAISHRPIEIIVAVGGEFPSQPSPSSPHSPARARWTSARTIRWPRRRRPRPQRRRPSSCR
jgi:hypothetical protein